MASTSSSSSTMNHRSGAWCATRWRILAIICLWSLACARQPAPAIDAALPLDCSGILGPEASAASLAERFGAANVAEDSVALGDTEGDMLPASRLFPRDS